VRNELSFVAICVTRGLLFTSILKDYLVQILSALNVIHAADLVHRGNIFAWFIDAHNPSVRYLGINARCVGLSTRERTANSKLVKVGKASFHTRLLELHRSNPFNDESIHDIPVPDAW
jgi:eukaryotic translation initiation factor 2-alpha kinase 4